MAMSSKKAKGQVEGRGYPNGGRSWVGTVGCPRLPTACLFREQFDPPILWGYLETRSV